MITCAQCGTQSDDGTRRCPKCGIAFSVQFQNIADQKRAQTGKIIRSIGWVVLLVILVIVGPPVYKAGGTAYLKHKMNTIADRAMKDCGGPPDQYMSPEQKAQMDVCIANTAELVKVKADYASFTK